MKLYTLILSILCCCSGLLAEAFHYTPGTVPHFEGSITRISSFSRIHDEKIEISVSSEERHGNYLTSYEYTWYAEPQDALTFGCQQLDRDLIRNRAYPEEIAETRKLLEDLASNKVGLL